MAKKKTPQNIDWNDHLPLLDVAHILLVLIAEVHLAPMASIPYPGYFSALIQMDFPGRTIQLNNIFVAKARGLCRSFDTA